MTAQSFGPRSFITPVCGLDVRVGGSLRIVMRGPDGNDYPMKGVFREVIAPERLVFTNILVDQEGKHLHEGKTIVTFAESNDGSTLIRNSRSRSRSDRSANARRYGGGVVAKHRQDSRTEWPLLTCPGRSAVHSAASDQHPRDPSEERRNHP